MAGCSLYDSGHNYKPKCDKTLLSAAYLTHIYDKININGYYCRADKPNRGYIFYSDGTCVSFDFKDQFCDTIGYSLTQLMPYIYTMPDVMYYKIYDTFVSSGGAYKIDNNIIKADFYIKRLNGFLARPYWEIYSQQFDIVDKSTLCLSKNIVYDKTGTDTIDTNLLYKFVPVDTIPPSFYVEARKKKWLWDNKDDWKAYKQELKAYKRELKARKDSIDNFQKSQIKESNQ